MAGSMFGRKLDDLIPGTKFTYRQAVKSSEAVRHGLDNLPTNEEVWKRIEWFAKHVLQPINDVIPITVSSWFRSPELCKAIGSTPGSNHTRGDCADIEPKSPNTPNIELFNLCAAKFDCAELIAEFFPDGWVHCCCKNGVTGDVVKLKDAQHNYTRLTAERIYTLYKYKPKY